MNIPMPRVRVVVSDEKKRRWTDYVEKTTEYDSLSDLVRKSVEQEITGEERTEYEQLDELTTKLDQILENQRTLQDSIDAHRQNALKKENINQIQPELVEALWDFFGEYREIDD